MCALSHIYVENVLKSQIRVLVKLNVITIKKHSGFCKFVKSEVDWCCLPSFCSGAKGVPCTKVSSRVRYPIPHGKSGETCEQTAICNSSFPKVLRDLQWLTWASVTIHYDDFSAVTASGQGHTDVWGRGLASALIHYKGFYGVKVRALQVNWVHPL